MKKRITILFVLFSFLSITVNGQKLIKKEIYFDSDVYSLNSKSSVELERLLEDISHFSESSIQVIGYTDEDGSSDYNLELSKNRAEAVKTFLLNRGLDEDYIQLDFKGEQSDQDPLQSSLAKEKKRKVSIITTCYKYNSINEFVSQLSSQKLQEHKVSSRNSENILLTNGTEVEIPENAFVFEDGSPVDKWQIDLQFKEAYTYIDMVDESLFTQTKDQMLETGGMVYINASQNGRLLKLAEHKEIQLLLPVDGPKEGMEVFEGSKDENGITWTGTGKKVSTKNKGKEIEKPFIQVDLSSLLDFDFVDTFQRELSFEKMPKYPAKPRKVFPPMREKYSEKKYQEVYEKHVIANSKYESDKKEFPRLLNEWKKEMNRRKSILINHKKAYVRSLAIERIKNRLYKIKEIEQQISHDVILEDLYKVLLTNVDKLDYDQLEYFRKAYQGELKYAKEHGGLVIPYLELFNIKAYVRDFVSEYSRTVSMVRRKKSSLRLKNQIEDGVVNKNILSKYMVSSSSLGWINCDRFTRKSNLINLELAKLNNTQYLLVFKGIKSLIRPNQSKMNIQFQNIPKGEEVRLVALKVENGVAFLSENDFVLGANHPKSLEFKQARISDLEKVMSNI